jgi:hypothetical protein
MSLSTQSGNPVDELEGIITSKFDESRYKPSFQEEDDEETDDLNRESDNVYVGRGLYYQSTVDSSAIGDKQIFNDHRRISKFESPASTTFKISDLGELSGWKRKKWQRLQRWHWGTKPNYDGYGMEERQSQSERNDQIYKKSTAGALCDRIRMNTREREIVINVSTELDYIDFGVHSDILKGILGTMAVVAESRRPSYYTELRKEENVESYIQFQTSREDVMDLALLNRQSNFKQLMDLASLEYGGLNTIKRKIYYQHPWLENL